MVITSPRKAREPRFVTDSLVDQPLESDRQKNNDGQLQSLLTALWATHWTYEIPSDLEEDVKTDFYRDHLKKYQVHLPLRLARASKLKSGLLCAPYTGTNLKVHCQLMADLVGAVQFMFTKGILHRGISWSTVMTRKHAQELYLLDLDCACKMEDFTPVKCTDDLVCMAVDGMKVLEAHARGRNSEDEHYYARFELESIIYLFLFRLHKHLPKEVGKIIKYDLAERLAKFDLQSAWEVKESLAFGRIASALVRIKKYDYEAIVILLDTLHQVRSEGLAGQHEYLSNQRTTLQLMRGDEQKEAALIKELNSKRTFMTLSTRLKQAFQTYVDSVKR